VIRLQPVAPPEHDLAAETVRVGEPRRGFDYEAFETRLQSLWFQRKTFLSSGRDDGAGVQLENLRAFCTEEGVRRLEHLAGALVAEAHRLIEEGSYTRAITALHYAQAFDPDRPQIHLARAVVHLRSERRVLAAASELVAALRAAMTRSLRDFSLFHEAAFLTGLALLAVILVFATLMLLRYHVPLRHEVEEWAAARAPAGCTTVAGWTVVALPFVVWIGAGWAALYWMAATFRYMSHRERGATLLLLLLCLGAIPAYEVAVGLYGTSADPSVRITVASVGGEYDPDRILRLRQLVDAHPEDSIYRFLLAGLFKNGRYFEEAFDEYKKVLELNPTSAAAQINVGNIFYATGQYGEAIANYRRALELEPDSWLAHYNLHLAQSEDFRFAAAEQSLQQARRIDSKRVARMLSGAAGWGDRPAVQDATLQLGSVWEAALVGHRPIELGKDEGTPGRAWWSRLLHPLPLVSLLVLAACAAQISLARLSPPARRCIRCGRAFCHLCKSIGEGREYCAQCLHLYVLRDGLAPGTKSKKLYEVERYERRTRAVRGVLSALVPGAAQLLRGRTSRGLLLLLAWFVALGWAWPTTLARLTVAGVDLPREPLRASREVPALFDADPLVALAILALPAIWTAGNVWRWKRKEA
jgi:tetratricopeptide (TPR) repeat protein